MKTWIWVVALSLAAVLLGGCSEEGSSTTAVPSASPARQPYKASSAEQQRKIIRDLKAQLHRSTDSEYVIVGALCAYWPGAENPLVVNWLLKEYGSRRTSLWPSDSREAMAKYSSGCREMLAG